MNTESATWRTLLRQADTMRNTHLRDLFAADERRFSRFSLEEDGLLLDFSKQRIDADILAGLRALWAECDVPGWAARMRAGEAINHSEQRAALHIALRHSGDQPMLIAGSNVMPAVRATLGAMQHFCDTMHAGTVLGASRQRIRHVVNIGIGGSDLGPRMATQALAAHQLPGLDVQYVSNVDASHLATALRGREPATTLFIVASKTFTTQETLRNAHSAREWIVAALGEAAVAHHFAGVTANVDEALRFGIDAARIFPFWGWVGGRFSVWSAIGLPLALAIGFDNFRALLAGGEAMDRHFLSAPVERNLPATLALLELWNTNFLHAETRAVMPYSHSLELLPRYLQQLEMESNGKGVDRTGTPLTLASAPIVWGEAGTDGQHAFFQLLHQGGRLVPCEFIACARPDFELPHHHASLLANCFAQSEALMRGKTRDEARAELISAGAAPERVELLASLKACPGNQPSSTLLLPRLDPYALGRLIALYEHKTFALGVLWGINSFDQWGVELGKQLASRLLPMLVDDAATGGTDSSTAGLVAAAKRLARP